MGPATRPLYGRARAPAAERVATVTGRLPAPGMGLVDVAVATSLGLAPVDLRVVTVRCPPSLRTTVRGQTDTAALAT